MRFGKNRYRGPGTALRIALLSWMVTLTTLVFFVLLTLPYQKKAFLRNLESKANSVAVSLHDVSAGAAINDDFASVVGACQTMLAGDPDLDFLIVAKNDGFSLLFEPTGWRAEPKIGSYWLPNQRRVVSGITTVPLFQRRVFHFAQPFDYSGIQWGWIHVGLSLKDYDQSVSSLYRNTALLALACLVFGLVVSLIQARQLVRPILRLRHLVQRIADGDLSVRAETSSHDELGSLAESVNTMTEALLRRDHILESVRFAAQEFMQTARWEDAINPVLAKIGPAADASRAYLFENGTDAAGRLCMSQRHEWARQGISPQIDNPELQQLPYADSGFGRWCESLANNEIINGPVSEMSPGEREVLEPQDIRSLIIIPVFVEGDWWGFLGLDDCVQNRRWTDAEEDSLRAGADMLGATIARQRAQEALLEAKTTLEQRVQKRTQELQDQVAAKERALAELAAAQSSLLEMSHAAGMAEVATGVLHNVGNVLNSINVSCTLLMDQLRESRIGNVAKIAEMLANPKGGLSHFLTEDPHGQQLPVYLPSLATSLQEEQQLMFREAQSLHDRIDHIKEIVSMQQSYGRVSGVTETIAPEQLMEDALKLNAGALRQHGITVQRQYRSVPSFNVDKHKILQILLNLISNARHACSDGNGNDSEKIITLRIASTDDGRVRLEVADNGIGIPPENLTSIFQHGFTTRRSGHGFGLHAGALAARQLGGTLGAHSDGPGLGATFTLELPCDQGENT